MIRAAIHGRLGSYPVQRQTRTGSAMLTASLAVNVARPGEEPATEWLNLVAFGAAGELLARHCKGDLVDVMGALTRSTYADREGKERASWGLSVEAILSARTAGDVRAPKRRNPSTSPRPRGGRASTRSLYSTPQKPGRTSGPELPADRVDDLYADGLAP
jgi:single-stranded DNA-binding protein